MIEWAKDGRDILNSRTDIDPKEKTRMEHYLALIEGDIEAIQNSVAQSGLKTSPLPKPEVQATTFTLSTEQRQALKERARGEKKEVVVYTIQPRSITVQLQEDGQYFIFVNDSPNLRELVRPQTFDIAFFVDKKQKWARPIPKSNNSSLQRQRELIEGDFSQSLNTPGVKAIMAHAYVLTQADIAHQKKTGTVLIPDYFARTPDETFGSDVARVGRRHPGRRLDVDDWRRDDGRDYVWALPAIVSANLEI